MDHAKVDAFMESLTTEFPEGEVIEGYRFAGGDLRWCSFRDVTFRNCSFDNAVADGVLFDQCVFDRCSMERFRAADVRLHDCKFNTCSLKNSTLSAAFIEGCEFKHGSAAGSDWSYQTLKNTSFLMFTLSEADSITLMTDSRIVDCGFIRCSLSGLDLDGSQVYTAVIDSSDMAQACLVGATVRGLVLKRSGLDRSRLDNSLFQFCVTTQSDLSSARLHGANFTNCRFVGTDLKSDGAYFAECEIE